jgi:hypothetical protein
MKIIQKISLIAFSCSFLLIQNSFAALHLKDYKDHLNGELFTKENLTKEERSANKTVEQMLDNGTVAMELVNYTDEMKKLIEARVPEGLYLYDTNTSKVYIFLQLLNSKNKK